MQFVNPEKFLDWLLVVVDAQVPVAVVEPGVATLFPDDVEGGRLPAALVASGLLPGHERRDHALAQVPLGLFERARHLLCHVLAGDRDFGTTPVDVEVAMGSLPISFRFVLEGYDVRSFNVVPDSDRPVSVELRAKTPGSPATAVGSGDIGDTYGGDVADTGDDTEGAPDESTGHGGPGKSNTNIPPVLAVVSFS